MLIDSTRRRLVVAFIAAALGWPAGAPAQDKPEGRACTAADLAGSWAMQGMSVARTEQVDRNSPAYFPHQRFVFLPEGTVKHFASGKPLTDADRARLRAMPPTSKWSVDDRGWLTIRKPGVAEPERLLCAFMVRGVEPPPTPAAPRRGDVLLNHMRGDVPAVQKLLRKTVD